MKKTCSWLEVFCVRSNESECVQIICVGRLKFEEDLLLVGSPLCVQMSCADELWTSFICVFKDVSLL